MIPLLHKIAAGADRHDFFWGLMEMKRILLMLLAVFLCLNGCQKGNDELERVMSLRTKLLGSSCQFEAAVTADYGDKTCSFSVACTADQAGNLQFEVLRPATISGITGSISEGSGKLTFDDAALAFPLQADGLLSPVSGPWVLLQALRGGYVRHCVMEDGLLRVRVDDSFEDDALTLDIWLDGIIPVRGDIYEENRRILAIEVKSFVLQ